MDLGIPELIIILVIAVLLFGPGRLSKIGGELGSGINAFRRGLQSDEDDDETTPAKGSQSEADDVVPVTAGGDAVSIHEPDEGDENKG